MAGTALRQQLEAPIKGTSLWRDATRRLVRNPAALVGLFLVLGLIFVAVFAPLISPYDPTSGTILQRFRPPSLVHLLGTDLQGRDILSRIMWGARSSLWVSILSVTIGLSLGLSFGAVSGFVGGWVDFWMMRAVDVMLSLPGLLLTITIVLFLGPGLNTIAFAIAIENVPIFARLVRSSILALKENDFVLAARSVGATRRRILLHHVMPNALTPVIVQATLALATAIVDAAGLGYLGFGPQDPATPEWGTMLTDTQRYLTSGAAYTALFPGIAIILAVLGFNLLGDGLREALDPRLKR
ncbi:MAG TPA: ABC transporter permease [Candidatus Limnocylindrales bacterium]